ncbi:MAG: DUF1461 domain-containing protein [Saccharospirillaceae bacterium]|nr:DUF1461 domain-containing protein [Saccharospirillaceae bacterium]
MIRRLQAVLWFVALLAGFVAALFFSWNLLASQDYGYRWFYDIYDIERHIDKFGPQNRYISGLELVDRDDHERMFAEIVHGVHHQGEGLAQIAFQRGEQSVVLMRSPEIVHLQDVANLVDAFQVFGFSAVLTALLLVILLLRSGSQPAWFQQLGLLLGLMAVLTVMTFLIGPKTVFYQMHVWMFPPDHEWFFYYQDSLMTTLMKAPVIFGGIALAMIFLALVLFALYIAALRRYCRTA